MDDHFILKRIEPNKKRTINDIRMTTNFPIFMIRQAKFLLLPEREKKKKKIIKGRRRKKKDDVKAE